MYIYKCCCCCHHTKGALGDTHPSSVLPVSHLDHQHCWKDRQKWLGSVAVLKGEPPLPLSSAAVTAGETPTEPQSPSASPPASGHPKSKQTKTKVSME